MRIQAVINRYFPAVGGAERQLALLASELRNRNHHISILTRHIQRGLPFKETIDGVLVTRLRPSGLGKAANAFIILRIIAYLINHRNDYDLIHSQTLGPIAIASVLAGKILRKPVILRVAGVGDIARQREYLQVSVYSQFVRRFVVPPFLWRWILNGAATIVALSQEITEEIRAHKVRAPLRIIPNGVDTRRYCPASSMQRQNLRHMLNLPVDIPILFTTGRLVAGKRLDVLLSAMPHVLAELPDCVLLIAGSGKQQVDSVETTLRQQVRDLGLKKSVFFVGLIDNVDDYLRASDIFVFPSEKEGMPNALLEAMACGLPAIARDIGGVRDIVSNDTAMLVPSSQAKEFADAVKVLLNNPDRAQELGHRARQHIEVNFSIEAITSQYEALYQEVINYN